MHAINQRKHNFLNSFPNFNVPRNGEKRFPMIACSQKDPQNFFSCNTRWQVCAFDFTFRKIISDCVTFRAAKINVVPDYFYGQNDPLLGAPKDHVLLRRWEQREVGDPVTSFEDLVVYRGIHICDSETFKLQISKMFNHRDQEHCDKLLNLDVFKINKIKHQERYEKFLTRFKDEVKKFARKDYYQRLQRKKEREERLQAKKRKVQADRREGQHHAAVDIEDPDVDALAMPSPRGDLYAALDA